MQIFVLLLNGFKIQVDVLSGWDSVPLTSAIAGLTSIPSDQIRLLFRTRLLVPGRSLRKLGVTCGDTICMALTSSAKRRARMKRSATSMALSTMQPFVYAGAADSNEPCRQDIAQAQLPETSWTLCAQAPVFLPSTSNYTGNPDASHATAGVVLDYLLDKGLENPSHCDQCQKDSCADENLAFLADIPVDQGQMTTTDFYGIAQEIKRRLPHLNGAYAIAQNNQDNLPLHCRMLADLVTTANSKDSCTGKIESNLDFAGRHPPKNVSTSLVNVFTTESSLLSSSMSYVPPLEPPCVTLEAAQSIDDDGTTSRATDHAADINETADGAPVADAVGAQWCEASIAEAWDMVQLSKIRVSYIPCNYSICASCPSPLPPHCRMLVDHMIERKAPAVGAITPVGVPLVGVPPALEFFCGRWDRSESPDCFMEVAWPPWFENQKRNFLLVTLAETRNPARSRHLAKLQFQHGQVTLTNQEGLRAVLCHHTADLLIWLFPKGHKHTWTRRTTLDSECVSVSSCSTDEQSTATPLHECGSDAVPRRVKVTTKVVHAGGTRRSVSSVRSVRRARHTASLPPRSRNKK